MKNIFLQIIRHVWERRAGLRQLQPSFCLSLSLQVFLITIIEKITMHHNTDLLFGCARSFFETGPFSVPRRKTVFSQPDDFFRKPLIGWLVLFLHTQYGGADKNNLYKMQLIAILPHQTMHRDNFGLKSGFVSSGTKGSSGPRSQLPTCRAGIQLNLPTTGEESKEENAIFLVQNAIFLPTTHLQSHNHFSPFQAMSNQRIFRGLRKLFPKILEVDICYFNLS